jgi:hypothetical protein
MHGNAIFSAKLLFKINGETRAKVFKRSVMKMEPLASLCEHKITNAV